MNLDPSAYWQVSRPPFSTASNTAEEGEATQDPQTPISSLNHFDGLHMCPSCKQYGVEFSDRFIMAD